MSSSQQTTTANSNYSSTYRVNYSEYVADITGSPKTARKLATTTIGSHNNPIINQNQNRPSQPVHNVVGMPQYGGGSDKCARCSKTVYLAEKKTGAGKPFHTSCFNCYTCKRKLDSTGLSEHKGEIYCKSCYTKQFGAHGIVSGVTMSTEHQPRRDYHHERRASYGSDLDTTHIARQRTHSAENLLHDQQSTRQNDKFLQQNIRRIDVLHDRNTSPSTRYESINAVADTKYQRSPSPTNIPTSSSSTKYQRSQSPTNIGMGYDSTKQQRVPSPIGFQRITESSGAYSRQQSDYTGENDRNIYIHKGDTLTYNNNSTNNNRTSAVVDIPIITTNTKRPDSTINRLITSNDTTRDIPLSPSPSVSSTDSYRRQTSRERNIDSTDSYFRSNSNDSNISKSNQTHSSYTTGSAFHPTKSYENAYSSSNSTVSNAYRYDSDQNRSRDSSPTSYINRNRPSSPTIGANSSSSTVTTTRTTSYRSETVPSTTGLSQVDYRYSQTSTSSNAGDRRSPSPQPNNRPISGLNDFVIKTNIVGGTTKPSADASPSVLGALVGNFSKPKRSNYDDDDDFDN